jgi:hypothetical protein
VDLHELTPIACQAFRQNAFYRQALGLDEEQFNRYWKAFLALALSDSACRVYGATTESGLAGAIVIGLHGFPRPFTGLRFLCALLTRLGPRRLARYLRFVRAYDRAMDRPEEELRVEGSRASAETESGSRPDSSMGATLACSASTGDWDTA